MHSSRSLCSPERARGWILDAYPSELGEFAVWIISEEGERLRYTDCFKPKIYVSGKDEGLERLAAQLPYDRAVVSWDFV